jgi:dynamin 1-like protein
VRNNITKSNNFKSSLKISKFDVIESLRGQNLNKLTVPGIVVAGAQSSGKSSLLESISGIKLPSGKTITTRVPLIIRLQNDQELTSPYALISAESNFDESVKITDISKIPKRIIELTNKMSETGCVGETPINLKVFGPNLPTLTLIDLPGITHLSKNEQSDIHEMTSNLVRRFIKDENMIILCVIPAIDDFSNTEAIRLAREYDPHGRRTIGVVTKVDLINKHTGIQDKLYGKTGVTLKLGFVAVKNKSPGESDMTMTQLREVEKNYFKNSKLFDNVPIEFYGTETLVNRITELQNIAIDKFLPQAKEKLLEIESQLENELNECKIVFGSEGDKLQYVLRVMVDIVSKFKSLANGQYDSASDCKVLSQLSSFYTTFSKNLFTTTPDFISEEWKEVIVDTARESQEILLDNFISHNAFRTLFVSNHVDRYTSNCMQLIEEVFAYISTTLHGIVSVSVLPQYPGLKSQLKKEVSKVLQSNLETVKKTIKMLLDAEEFIFTRNPLYSNATTNDNENPIASCLQAYSEIATARFVDYVVLIIHKHLVSDVYKTLPAQVCISDVASSFQEDSNNTEQRSRLEIKINECKRNLELIDSIKE